MSENPKTIPSTAIESGGDESREYEIDPELDIRSEYFNPIKALYAPEIKIPVQNPRLYNNVAQYESAMKRLESGQTSTAKVATKTQSKSYRQEVELHQRRFLPHQEMVKGRGKSARQTRNLLLRMASDKLEGPLCSLKAWKDQRKRVKICTRNVTTINGYATGFIEAFDKHWNIVLCDVIEVWKRKKFHYCPKAMWLHADDDDDDDNNSNKTDEQLSLCMQRLKVLNITIPSVTVKSLNRKLVECSRNVPKLLIRGEQIATIILDSHTIKPETEIKLQPL